MNYVKNLDTLLLRISRQSIFSARDACAGVHIFGGIGSGKTSGSGHMLAGAYLRAGMGGYTTAVKADDVELWLRYASEHGRLNSVILLDENEGFNFLQYSMARYGVAGIGTVVDALMRVIEAARHASGTASQRGEVFWEDSTRTALRYTLPLLYAARGTLTVPDILRFITTAPASLEQAASQQWKQGSFMFGMLARAAEQPVVRMTEAALQNLVTFWREQWPGIPDKTRGNIVISITAALDRFNHGRLNQCFCGKTTVVPEMAFHGAVLVDAKPTLTWSEDGVIAQQLFKFFFQRATLSRNGLPEPHRERLVYLWCDEAQETVNSYDGEFLSLCRASKCCTVYLTQSLPTYYAKMGGDNPRDAAHALVGKFMTNIFHSNACPETNEYASRVIGKVMTHHENYSRGNSSNLNLGMSAGSNESWGTSSSDGVSYGGGSSFTSSSGSNSGSGNNWGQNRGRGTSRNESRGYSESMEYAIEPGDFARYLLTGGPENGNRVTGVWFQAGRTFRDSGTNYLLGTFIQ